MRYLPLVCTALVVAAAITFGQTDGGVTQPQAEGSPRSYVVTFSEFRLSEFADPALSSRDIADAFNRLRAEGTLDLVQSVRVAGVAGERSELMFSTSVPMTQEITIGENGASTRSVSWRDIGTIVRLDGSAQPGGMMLMKLQYETSAIQGDSDEPMGASQPRARFQTAVLLEPGRPVFVGGTSEEESCYLMAVLEE